MALTAADLNLMLRDRFPPASHALFFQVRNRTGHAGSRHRYADAVAMSLWPSRGLELMGFEIKVSRADWLQEMKNPSKAEEIAQYCDRWWLVVADRNIVQPGELPPTWGLLAPRGKKLVVAVEAPPLEPVPLDRAFLAALLRKANETHSPEEELKAKYDEGFQVGKASMEGLLKHQKDLYQTLHGAIEEFEQKSGVRISTWNAGRMGEAVRVLLDNNPDLVLRRLEQTRSSLEHLLGSVQETIQKIERENPANPSKK